MSLVSRVPVTQALCPHPGLVLKSLYNCWDKLSVVLDACKHKSHRGAYLLLVLRCILLYSYQQSVCKAQIVGHDLLLLEGEGTGRLSPSPYYGEMGSILLSPTKTLYV